MKTKQFATLEVKALESEDPNGAFEAVLSAPTLDRDGEIIPSGAFNPLPSRIPIHVNHFMTTDALIGSAEPFYDEGVLKVRGTFASTPDAQRIRTLILEGHLLTMSVGFLPAQGSRKLVDGVPHITKAEILEGSFVTVPSNREALLVEARSVVKVGSRNNSKDSERLQSIHDLAVENGASCETASVDEDDSDEKGAKGAQQAAYKLLAGSLEERARVRAQALKEAVSEAYGGAYVYIIGTFDDAVVCSVWDYNTGEDLTVRIPYTVEDDGTLSLGTAEDVAVEEVVTTSSPSTDPEKAAAPAAAKSPADVEGLTDLAFWRAKVDLLDL